jgi:hypothetical protein
VTALRRAIEAPEAFPALRTLRLRRFGLTAHATRALFHNISPHALPSLTSLDIGSNPITRPNHKVDNPEVNQEGVTALAEVLRRPRPWPELDDLSLSDLGLDPPSAFLLLSVLDRSQLSYRAALRGTLDLSGNVNAHFCGKAAAIVSVGRRLRVLDLRATGPGSVDLCELAEAIQVQLVLIASGVVESSLTAASIIM